MASGITGKCMGAVKRNWWVNSLIIKKHVSFIFNNIVKKSVVVLKHFNIDMYIFFITRNCWVIDPLKPNKSHMHRRIHLSQSISVTITIQDPLHPTALPIIKFSGSDNEVTKQKNYVSNNIHVCIYLCLYHATQ